MRGNEEQSLSKHAHENGPRSDSEEVQAELQQRVSQVQSDMVHMVSHRFRTPLSILLTSSELLEYYSKSLDEEKKLEHLCRIRAAVLDLSRMLDEILSEYGQSSGAKPE